MREYSTDLLDILPHVNPSLLDYQEWVSVGMALNYEGYSADVWDEWSRRDPSRYHSGECQRKWRTFYGGGSSPVTAATVVKLAKDQGWHPTPVDDGPILALDWDAYVGDKDDLKVVDTAWIEGEELQGPSAWHPAQELIRYLEALFDSTETVGYVTDSWEKDGRFMPTKGVWSRTAGELIEALARCNDDLGAVLGDYKPQVGAWIRFNPLDGKGCKNENVTDYRFALVESDTMDLETQNAIIRKLELPVACLVYSGKKSLHAIVRIEAENYTEYRKRVNYLYDVCEKNGLKIDTQNRNPSRLSRMPGVIRGDRKQYLIDTNIGHKSWKDWYEWIESVNDNLPEPENLADFYHNLPELAPPLIAGVLRQGHKMLLAGPSKAGKSFALIELCIAIAEGIKWLEWQCAKGRVMYVNLELDRASCLHRFRDVYEAMGIAPSHLEAIDIWNLRGKSVPMDQLAPKLIRRAQKKDYAAIIIDPIYKIITGDENSADQMAHFCNQFDKVCTELGSAVIYCHHHSKGYQGGKRSMDRASGSGVFARDPDALLDLTELDVEEATVKAVFGDKVHATAWRIEGTLREFERFAPVDLWFTYPVHQIDTTGVLNELSPEGGGGRPSHAGKPGKSKEDRKRERIEALDTAYEALKLQDVVTIKDLAGYMGVSDKTVKRRLKESEKYSIEYEKGEEGCVKKL
ncbi:AAA family ATPase [Peptococcus simiae]|uniref:AAA family ATPase n=1 Tax=Peptococcus simiae TaxID=1643805 RepID=A0ABW9H0R9_9FIRM